MKQLWLGLISADTTSQYTVTDIIALLQECMEGTDFCCLPIQIRNQTIVDEDVVRDAILDLCFLGKLAVVLFHEEKQQANERPEPYNRAEKAPLPCSKIATE